jgi:hypothetical protein
MKTSRRSLLVFSATTGAAAALAASASAAEPVRTTLYQPSFEVCRQSLAGTPGSFSDPGVAHVLSILDQALTAGASGSALVTAVGLALEDSYPGNTSMTAGQIYYTYLKDPETGIWYQVCHQTFEALVQDVPGDPVVVSFRVPAPVI